jgi:hypothetical protein
MTLRPAHLLAAAAILLTASRPALAEHPTPPCALLTSAQIKAVLSTPVLNGKPGSPSDGTLDCTWPDAHGQTRLYLSLKQPGIDYKSFRDSMQATGRLVPVSGLSGDAFFISSPGTSAALYVLKGRHLLLITVDGVGFTKPQNEVAEQALATEILPKL